MNILGIESSCDETGVAIVSDDKTIHANLVLSQLKEHEAFGGVVPEIAARAHLDHMDSLLKAAMTDSGMNFSDLDGVAATCGPGLIGGVMVGMMTAKAIAAAHNLPFIAVNHLEAHALTPRLTDDLDFPYLLLLVSGGHTQTLIVEGVGRYKRLGTTLDDALGECFDKSAKLMGLPYPGGPNLEKLAAECTDPDAALKRFDLPRPMLGREEPDFSFSGLKTAVRQYIDSMPGDTLERTDMAALAHSFQCAVTDIVTDRCAKAIDIFINSHNPKNPTLVVSGGVAANTAIRNALQDLTSTRKIGFVAPPLNLCSDNGAMIAWTGIERLREGLTDPLDTAARPRWPLDPEAKAKTGAGVKA